MSKSSQTVTFLYLFREKLNTEDVMWFDATKRAKQLKGCTRARIFSIAMFSNTKDIREYNGTFWEVAEDVPEEIKLAAMLL